jgi:site-specific DNA-methyltransferase (adenine-specific)
MNFDSGALQRITDTVLSYNPKLAKPKSKPEVAVQGRYEINRADAFVWLAARAENSIHAIVTDPPYGLKEFTDSEQDKMRSGKGGVWRIPPSFDGAKRMAVPRFTVLDETDIAALLKFFETFAKHALRVLVPGGHVMIATNPLLSQHVYVPMMEAGFEKRGEIIRLVQTLRGGDRPKNAHVEFKGVSVMPRSAWEPWGLFRKPLEGRVQDNLRKWSTGGLRRISGHEPFLDVIRSSPTRAEERKIAPHPSLKPQALMRQLVTASLPLGKGIVCDPFMGGGSTIAAAVSVGYESIGIEQNPVYFKVAEKAVPALARLTLNGASSAKGRAGGLSAVTKKPKANSHTKGRRVRRKANG